MRSPTTAKMKRRLRKLKTGLRRSRAQRRLTRDLAGFSNKELAGVLAKVGIRRADLFTGFEGNPRHRRRMGRMMEHFDIDRETACEHHWRKLVYADKVCARCPNVPKCQRWLAWGRENGAPNVFCPNAGLFTQLRLDLDLLMRTRPRTYALGAGAASSDAGSVATAWRALDRAEAEPFWRRGPGSGS